MARPKIYLAGPEVFLRKPKHIGSAKALICARHGLNGQFPLDSEIDLTGLTIQQQALAIFRANEALIEKCDALIANMTPFRGVGMDVGTAYEIGFMRGKGKPVFGYSNDHRLYFDRARKWETHGLKSRKNGDPTLAFEDSHKMAVEQFGLVDNLMIDSAIMESGGQVLRGKTKRRDRYTDLAVFEDCVKLVAEILLKPTRLS